MMSQVTRQGQLLPAQSLSYGLISRKLCFDGVVGTTMGFVGPLIEYVQTAGDAFKLSCKTKPGVAGIQEIVA